jgi:predicted nucleotidyltransferase
MLAKRLEGRDLERELAAVTAALVRALSPERIILFGSFARGDQNRASDLDVVVIAPVALPFCERIGRALSACYAISPQRGVEPLVYTPVEWESMISGGNSFAKLVLREGRVLYDRRSQPGRGATVADAGAP